VCTMDLNVEDRQPRRGPVRLLVASRKFICRPFTLLARRVRGRREHSRFAAISERTATSPLPDSAPTSNSEASFNSINSSVDGRVVTLKPEMATLSAPPEPRFSSLVQQETEPVYTVIFPQWMVEVYQDVSAFGNAARRLFLPENSIKSKLPYYRCCVLPSVFSRKLALSSDHCSVACRVHPFCACREAVTNPGTIVKLDGKFEHLTQQYKRYGRYGRFESSSTVDRKRGRRFDMPMPGMKSIVATEIVLTWFLSTVYV
jgi:hypothetical protein